MTKKELLKHNPPHKIILEIYKDDDEIPKELIEILYHQPKLEERKIIIHCGVDSIQKYNDMFNKAAKEFIESHYD